MNVDDAMFYSVRGENAGVQSPLRGFAERSWNGGSSLDHDEFAEIDAALPPAQNLSTDGRGRLMVEVD